MGLTAATYLGDNTVPILDSIVSRLRTAGIDMAIDASAERSSAEARRRAGGVDLVWMCGYLTVEMLRRGELDHEVVAAPVFPGECGPVYRSVLVSRVDGPDDLASALTGVVAINEEDSWSGHHGLRTHVEATAAGRWFATELVTGSHLGSVMAVADRSCDIAAIDETVWRHIRASDQGAVAGLRVVGRTDDWPAPPLSLARRLDPALRAGVTDALLETGATGRPVGLVATDRTAYDTMTTSAEITDRSARQD